MIISLEDQPSGWRHKSNVCYNIIHVGASFQRAGSFLGNDVKLDFLIAVRNSSVSLFAFIYLFIPAVSPWCHNFSQSWPSVSVYLWDIDAFVCCCDLRSCTKGGKKKETFPKNQTAALTRCRPAESKRGGEAGGNWDNSERKCVCAFIYICVCEKKRERWIEEM